MAKEPTPRCSGVTRSGEPCNMAAGYGTDHPGTGNCKFHGGASSVVTGLYSKTLRTLSTDELEAIQNIPIDDPTSEIQQMMGMVLSAAKRWSALVDQKDPLAEAAEASVLDYLERLAKLKQGEGKREDRIPIAEVVDLVKRILQIVLPAIPDEGKRVDVEQRVRQLRVRPTG